ncbi:type VII secretion system-associated protein [Streptomyces sp. NPDC020996]|uniref:type VII secretion system-associated protein n=1 Tax=Streptomyces sp. NPDC020996 TaxID=3154791 RepID=UPI0033F3A62B
MTDLTHLDGQQLKRFREEDVNAFRTALKAILADSATPPVIRALGSLVAGRTTPDTLNQNQVLAIGNMSTDDLVQGKTLVGQVTSAAKGIDDILVAQQTLFEDLDDNLQTTIETLLKNQGDSLTAIDGEKLLDVFSDVNDDLGSAGGSNSSSTKS